MGALQNSGDGRTFLNTFKGKFTVRVNEQTEGAIKRTNKVGKDVYELHYDTLEDVVLQKIEKRESEDYGLSWNVFLAEARSDEAFTLTLPFSSRITMGLFLRLPNMELNKPFSLKLYYFDQEERASMVVYQNRQKVEPAFTKDNPNGLPDLVKTVINGQSTWDSTARMEFLEKLINEQVNPQLNQLGDHSDIETEDDAPGESKTFDSSAIGQPIWDAENKCLKALAEDGNYYEVDEKGEWKMEKGEKIGVLPF